MVLSGRQRGFKAHSDTIGPSHDKFLAIVRRKYRSRSATQPTGLPDIIVHCKDTIFFEIKPHKVIKNDSRRFIDSRKKRRYLSENQEKTIRRLLKEGEKNIFIVYYCKYKRKSGDRFVYRQQKLNLENLKRFCFDSDDDRKFDADELFWKKTS